MKQKAIKWVVFFLCIGLLLFPLFQNITNVIAIPGLLGAYKEPEKPELSYTTWFSGDFQILTDSYVKEKLSIRSFLIRMHNQLNFSLFNQVSSKNNFIGLENYLFTKNILNSYYGEGLLSEDKIYSELQKLKYVQDTLAKLNKQIVFIIAPSKPSFCVEYIPEKYRKEKKPNNYDVYTKFLKGSGINFIDYTAYFKQLKKDSPYLLFPPKGLHWSFYGATIASDSLVNYIEAKAHTQLADYQWGEITVREAKDEDIDVENTLNLSYSIDAAHLAYPKLVLKNRRNDSLKVISISDSFYGSLYYACLKDILPPSNEYWFYGWQIYSEKSYLLGSLFFSQINLAQKIKESDFILILQNEDNLHSLGYGFINRLYQYFKNGITLLPFDVEYNKYVTQMVTEIQNDPDRLHQIEIIAKDKKVSVDSLVTVQAITDVEKAIWNKKIKIKK